MTLKNLKQFLFVLLIPLLSLGGTLSGEEELSQLDPALDRYRVYITEGHGHVRKPCGYRDAYGVVAWVELSNGLHFYVDDKDFNHKSSAEDYKETLELCYSPVGRYPPGTEVSLEESYTYEYREGMPEIGIPPRYIGKTVYRVNPLAKKIRVFFISGYGDSLVDLLPQVNRVEEFETYEETPGLLWGSNVRTHHWVEIELTDGSIWHRDFGRKKPNFEWKIGTFVLVSIDDSKGPSLFKIVEDGSLLEIRDTFGGISFQGGLD